MFDLWILILSESISVLVCVPVCIQDRRYLPLPFSVSLCHPHSVVIIQWFTRISNRVLASVHIHQRGHLIYVGWVNRQPLYFMTNMSNALILLKTSNQHIYTAFNYLGHHIWMFQNIDKYLKFVMMWTCMALKWEMGYIIRSEDEMIILLECIVC